MNYLAHLFLAGPEPEALLGALMGDFVKGVLDERYPAAITRALSLHRRIDTFTDAHPVTAASRSRISPQRRRFAGIMVDLFYDHFLAHDWDEHAREPPRCLHGARLRAAASTTRCCPTGCDRSLPAWPRPTGLHLMPGWIDPRCARRHEPAAQARDRLAGAGAELEANYAALEADFQAFFPDLVRFAQASRETLATESTEKKHPHPS